MSDQKRMGRPRKPPHAKLSHSVVVSMTPRTYGLLLERAERMHLPVAWLARSIIFTALEEPNE
jgi:hypothetical protein